VDPKRMYHGGHSTGAALVYLVAASSDRYRAVFSFGPAGDVSGYSAEFLPFDTSNPKEITLRSPGYWPHSIKSQTFVFEGTDAPSNIGSVRAMAGLAHNPLLHFHEVKGANHFSILAPTTEIVARKILQDDGQATNIQFTDAELNQAFAR